MDLSADDTGYYGRASSLSAAGATAGARCEPEPSAGSAARGGPPAIGSRGPQVSGEGEDESDVDVDDVERGGAPQDEPMLGVQEQGWPMEQNACDSDDGDDDDDDDDNGYDGGGVGVEEASRKPHLEAPSWSRELRDVVVAPFTESAGPSHGLPLDASVLDYFMLFWPDRLIDVFTQETNRYAEQKIAESGKADPLWSPTTSREMKAFFAVAIMMGIKDLPRVWCYWSGNPALRCEWVSGTMTHTRYSKVSQYLHARNNVGTPARGQRGYDPIYKVRNVVEEVRANFSRHYSPRRELSVDEGMIPFKGRLFFKQHMPAKPTKWGVKVWELCEAQTGYCLNFDIYTGRSAYGAATTADAAGDGGGACGDMASGGGGGACDGDGASGANGGRAGGGGGASDTGAYGGRVHGSGGACGDMASGGGGGDVCDGGANSGRTGGGGATYGGAAASGAGAFGGRAHGTDGAHGDTVSCGGGVGTCGASGANSGRTGGSAAYGGGSASGAGAFGGSADGRGGAGAVNGRAVGAVSTACAGGAQCAAACVYSRSQGSAHSDGAASVTIRAAHQTTGAGADCSAAGATALGGGTVAAFAHGAAAIAAGATRAAGGTLAGRVGGGDIGGAYDGGCGGIGGAYDGGCGSIGGAYDSGGGGGIGDAYDGGCGGGGITDAYDGGWGGIGDVYDDGGGGGIGDIRDGGGGIGDAYDGGCGSIGGAYDSGCGGIGDAYDGGCGGCGIGDAYDGGCGCGGIGDAHNSGGGGGGIGGAAHGGLSSRPAGADDAVGGADEAADDSGVRGAAGAALAGAGGGTCGPAGAGGGSLDGRTTSAGGARHLAADASVTACGIPSNGAARCVDGTPPRGLVESSSTARGIPSSAAHRIGHGSARSAGNRVPLSVVSVAARSIGGYTSHSTSSSAAPTVGNCTAHSVTDRTAQSVTNSTAHSVTDSTAHSTSNAAPRTTMLAAVATPAPAESGSLGYRVVMSLTRSYWHRNHHLYFDRYFSSPALLEDLRSRCGTYACGTVSLSRRGLPPPAREVASLLRHRGDVAFFQKGGLVLSVWRDKRVVATLSTNQDPRMVRPVDEGPIKPAPVVHYNRFMGGVDRSDQYRSYYAVGRASKKWWRYIVWFLLNLSIVNAWLLYRESPHEPPMPKNYDHFQFRVDLAEQLRGGHRRMGHHKGKRSRQVVSYVSAENMSAHRLVRTARGKKVCRLCSRHGRKTRAGRQVQTSFGCGICDVPLCRFGCFRDFHQV
ncbi:uncharacterized protein LOC133354203 isoform X2 [Lethenteron reissneri]|uniref:uncharacterized protein LOC133354203 isoform X2 n=1 Tax=Lethenteron reissneri TaxID=7753 RepID=UPI002AB7CACD|nr:uncharacterized protein LOC133354203 isoform X2 [Lethenteron reissneri]